MTWFVKRIMPLLLIALLAASCSRPMEPERRQNAQQAPNSEISIYSHDEAGTPGTVTEGSTPPLAGGPEKFERMTHLADNRALARKYPGIIVLNATGLSNKIALTFDDGPDERFTPQVLDVLKKNGVKATFFLVGARVAGHPEVTQRIHNEGHIIGNHTYWHPKLYKESLERMRWEASETDKIIRDLVGYSPKLFRSPYGGLNEQNVEALGDMNYSIVGWSVDSLDWKQIPADEVEKNVLNTVKPGSIILMHSGGDWRQDLSGMVAALDDIIPALKERGLEFVTVPQLIHIPHSK